MPPLPPRRTAMPQGTGLGPMSSQHSEFSKISGDRQRQVQERATDDSRSSGQGQEPPYGKMHPHLPIWNANQAMNNDKATRNVGRRSIKAIRMPRLPNPVHKMPQGTGLGKLSNHPMGAIARGRQEAVNARATMDSRSTGQGAEPVQGDIPPLGDVSRSRQRQGAGHTEAEGYRGNVVGGPTGKQPQFPKNPKRRAPEY